MHRPCKASQAILKVRSLPYEESSRDGTLWGPERLLFHRQQNREGIPVRGDSYLELWRMSKKKPTGEGEGGSEVQIPWRGPNSSKTPRTFHGVVPPRTSPEGAQKWQTRVSMKTEGLRSQAGLPASSRERHGQTWVAGGWL